MISYYAYLFALEIL